MNAKHTPGKWLYGSAYGNHSVSIESDKGIHIAAVPNHRLLGIEQGKPVYTWCDEGDANAKLIAAAPELLEALKLVLPLAKGYAAEHLIGSNSAYCQQADEVIAKATE